MTEIMSSWCSQQNFNAFSDGAAPIPHGSYSKEYRRWYTPIPPPEEWSLRRGTKGKEHGRTMHSTSESDSDSSSPQAEK